MNHSLRTQPIIRLNQPLHCPECRTAELALVSTQHEQDGPAWVTLDCAEGHQVTLILSPEPPRVRVSLRAA